MFTNKHVIIAMIVAPILAILAWVGVGQFAGEQPHKAVPGQTYPLVEQSNCRYPSGACDMKNEDFQLRLTLDPVQLQLVLTASHPLEGVMLGLAGPGADEQPRPMQAVGGQGLEWRQSIARLPQADERIRLVASAGGASYFVDTSTVFLSEEDD